MKIAIDTGHRGRLSKPNDPGAVSGALVEANIVAAYALAAELGLHAAGHTVFPLRDGEYRDRAERAEGYGCDAALACHVNAAGSRTADYGVILYWPGSTKGEALASAIATALADVVPWPVRVEAATPDRWADARAIVSRYACPAVCIEPGFITGIMGGVWFSYPDNIQALGRAVARGARAWTAP